MIESYQFKIALALLGALIILSNFVDFNGLIAKLAFPSKSQTSNKQSDFLEIVGLWYKLKNKCDACKLKVASLKLDEVFPLLNKVLEDEKTT